MNAKKLITDNLLQIVRKLMKEPVDVQVSISEKAEQGDYYTNVALRLASILHKKPLDIAYEIKQEFEKSIKGTKSIRGIKGDELGLVVSKIEIAAPGFVNFFLSEEHLKGAIDYIKKKGSDSGSSDTLKNQEARPLKGLALFRCIRL